MFDEKTYWNIYQDKNQLTFIDLIKGIIPKDLYDNILFYIKKEEKTKKILCNTMENMNVLIKEKIWKTRCQEVINTEIHLGINKHMKKHKSNNNNHNKNKNNRGNNNKKKNNKNINKNVDENILLDCIINNIKFGVLWMSS